MNINHPEVLDAALAYGDAVKAMKRALRARDDVRESMRAAEALVCDMDIAMRSAQRKLDLVMRRLADDELLDESLQRDGAMPAAGAA